MILDCITAQDMAFGAYDEDRYVKFMMQDIHEAFPGLGTGMPARWVQQWYSACYYWPNVTPLPPIGNPDLKGIVAGQMFDPATPYIWTQVSISWPSHLIPKYNLTSQISNHSFFTIIKENARPLPVRIALDFKIRESWDLIRDRVDGVR